MFQLYYPHGIMETCDGCEDRISATKIIKTFLLILKSSKKTIKSLSAIYQVENEKDCVPKEDDGDGGTVVDGGEGETANQADETDEQVREEDDDVE